MSEFKWLLTNETATYLLDFQSITVTKGYANRETYISIQIKIMPNQQGIQDEIASRKRYKLFTEGYENLKYSLCDQVISVNKINGQLAMKNISRTDYNNNEDILSCFADTNASFIAIVPDSIGDKVARKALKYANDHKLL